MEYKKYKGRYWTIILLFVFLAASVYLVLTYYQQLQKSEDLEQQIDDLTKNNLLAQMIYKQQTEKPAEQLGLEEDKLESDIELAKNDLRTSLIINDHIATLVQVAREAGVQLASVKSSESKSTNFETVLFDIMTLQAEARGSRSNSIAFVSKICEAFQTGIIHNMSIQIRQEPADDTIILKLNLDIYSYRDW